MREMDPDHLNRLPSKGPDLPESDHFFTCECGEKVDRRRLGDVMQHLACGRGGGDE